MRPLPVEPRRDANPKEQEQYKEEHAKITADNKKLADDTAIKEKEISRLNDKLKTDLKTLEKPLAMPPFLTTISMRQFQKLDADAFTLWLNWQPETNGYGAKKPSAKS